MNLSDFHMDTRSLSRDIVRTGWIIIAIYVLATLSNLFVTHHDQWPFFRAVILFPVLKMAVVMLCLDVYIRRGSRWIEYFTIVCVNLVVTIMILALYELPIVIYLLIFPVLISLFYYSQRLIFYSLVQGILTVGFVLALSADLRSIVTVSNITMVVSMLIATALIINNLRKRAFAMARDFMSVIQDKQDLQTKNIMMEKMNRIDPATELYNHRAFHEHLESIMTLHSSFGIPVYLALLDIDNFKLVNDTFGHASGDAVIKYVADQMKGYTGADDFASRYGGEEFAILSVDKTTEQFYEQLEQIRRAVSEKEHEELNGRRVTVSIGTQMLTPGMSKQQLFGGADKALYAAKRSGKNRTMVAALKN
jgi:diguanylate cyclase (GGDEF)-like protein